MSEQRNCLLGILLTPSEKERLYNRAKKQKLSVSSYARMILHQSGVFKPRKKKHISDTETKPVAPQERASLLL